MGIISTALSHLVKAGVSGEALVEAIADLEAEIQSFNDASIAKRRLSDAERQQRARDKKKNHVTSRDACDASLDKKTPHTPQKINPKVIPPISPQTQVAEAVEIWNAAADRAGLERVIKVTGRRQTAIRKRIEDFGLDGWAKAVAAVEKSPFHCGSNDRGWRANIDFVATESKFITLIERDAAPPVKANEARVTMPC